MKSVRVVFNLKKLSSVPKGKIRLYHAISYGNTNQILSEGLLLNKIQSFDAGGIWCSTLPYYNKSRDTIIADVPIKNTWKANETQYVVYQDIKPSDMKGILKVYRFGSFGDQLVRSDEIPEIIKEHGIKKVLDLEYGNELKIDLKKYKR